MDFDDAVRCVDNFARRDVEAVIRVTSDILFREVGVVSSHQIEAVFALVVLAQVMHSKIKRFNTHSILRRFRFRSPAH